MEITQTDLESHNFTHWDTGGNCTAYGKTIDDADILLTDEGGLSAPETFPCLIGCNTEPGDFAYTTVHNWDDVVSFVNRMEGILTVVMYGAIL